VEEWNGNQQGVLYPRPDSGIIERPSEECPEHTPEMHLALILEAVYELPHDAFSTDAGDGEVEIELGVGAVGTLKTGRDGTIVGLAADVAEGRLDWRD
jgi:hypothetical protein